MFRGSILEFLQLLCDVLTVNDVEWQVSYKEVKFKCRTRINEAEITEEFGDEAFDEFMKNEFIKFYLQVFKWSKELPDSYYLDIQLIKCGMIPGFYDQIFDLFRDVRHRLSTSKTLKLLHTITLSEESLPSRGQGFEIVPSALNSLYPLRDYQMSPIISDKEGENRGDSDFQPTNHPLLAHPI
jgi:hypothetical protein